LEGVVPGLRLVDAWITSEVEAELGAQIDAGTWRTDIARRVQQFGLRYSGRERRLPDHLDPLPAWLDPILDRLEAEGFASRPVQANVNEYLPGQGIARHRDLLSFGPVVAVVSLLAPTTMVFEHHETGERAEARLQPRSLVILDGASRREWMHSIPKRKNDVVDGVKVPRHRRVSLTFRTLA